MFDKRSQSIIERAKRAPRLSQAEERDFIAAWQARRDRRAAARLIEANMRHVVFTALQYCRYGISLDDLIGEGSVGLMKALDRFDLERPVRFSTYALYWVRAEIVLGVMNSWSLLSGPRGALDSRVFFRLRRERSRLSAEFPKEAGAGEATLVERLAASFGVSEPRMAEMLGQLDARGISLDSSPRGGDPVVLPELSLDAEQGESLERREGAEQLGRILERVRGELDRRETFILERRLLADPEERLSLGEIGAQFGVSRERVRQIEARAQRKLESQARQEELGAAICAA